MKKITVIAACAAVVLMLGACVPTEKTAVNAAPEKPEGAVEFDFTQIHNDVMDLFEGYDMYAFVSDLNISGSNGGKKVRVTAALRTDMDQEALDAFMAAVLRRINDAAIFQDSRLTASSAQNMGDFWKTYGCDFSIHAATATGEAGEAVRTLSFGPGEEIGISPDTETYEAEWLRELEIYQRNAA